MGSQVAPGSLVGSGLPYLPLVEALRPLHGSPVLGEVPGGLGELARLMPELLAAALGGEQLPRALHDLLLRRVARLDAETRLLLRVAAAAGRDVPYRLLAAVVDLPEPPLLAALHQAVEHGVLVPDAPAGALRFRHALLAEAVYATLLPGEREAVLQLLARGYTNRQVASELVISVKTASVHVSHILAKLGVSSRLEAAAVAQRLLGPAGS